MIKHVLHKNIETAKSSNYTVDLIVQCCKGITLNWSYNKCRLSENSYE